METIKQDWDYVRNQLYALENDIGHLGLNKEDEYPHIKAWRAKIEDLTETLNLLIPAKVEPCEDGYICPNCDLEVDPDDNSEVCDTCGQRLDWHDVDWEKGYFAPRVKITGYSIVGVNWPYRHSALCFEDLDSVQKEMNSEFSKAHDIKLYLSYDTSKGRHMECLIYAERGVTNYVKVREQAMRILEEKIIDRSDDEFAPFGLPVWAVGDEVIEE